MRDSTVLDKKSDTAMTYMEAEDSSTAAIHSDLDKAANKSMYTDTVDDPGVVMKWDDAERFLTAHEKKGRSKATLDKYRLALEQLYGMLPEDKLIYRDTLSGWRDELLDAGYLKASVNTKVSACNQFLAFIGRREYQVVGQLAASEEIQPELTRNEYKRLLSAAKTLDDERTYFVTKVFACTGISVQELPQITAENVEAGRFMSSYQGTVRRVWIPSSLRQELIDYAKRNGISSGPLFLSRSGKPLSRITVTSMISRLSQVARVDREKCNPRCLRKLFISMRATVEANIEVLVEQALERQLDQEQLTVGWGA